MYTFGLRKKAYAFSLRPAYWALNIWKSVMDVTLKLKRIIEVTLER